MELDIYHVKGIVNTILLPSYTAVAISLIGVVISLWRRTIEIGMLLILLGGLYYLVCSLPITGFLLYRSLENRTPGQPDPATLIRNGVRHVVVMGDVNDGVEMWRKVPGATLILSSGSYTHIMAKTARQLGVADDVMVLETKGRNTEEQAREIKAMLGKKPFVLSTWGVHMWRSLKVFRAEGLDPIPAPNRPVPPPRDFRTAITPSRRGQFMTAVAIHEYLGALWVHAKGLFRFSHPAVQPEN